MKRNIPGLRRAALLAASAATLLLACSSPPGDVGNSGNGGRSGSGSGGSVAFVVPGLDGGGGTGSLAEVDAGLDGGPVGPTCGNTTIRPNRAPVDVFIVLDRSGSPKAEAHVPRRRHPT